MFNVFYGLSKINVGTRYNTRCHKEVPVVKLWDKPKGLYKKECLGKEGRRAFTLEELV